MYVYVLYIDNQLFIIIKAINISSEWNKNKIVKYDTINYIYVE